MKELPPDGSIDAGLLLLGIAYEGVPLSAGDIAEVCDTTVQNIQNYEYRAIRKIRAEFRRRGIDERHLL